MGEVGKEIAKSVTSEMAGTVTELAFSALVTAAGFPSAAIALPLAKGLVLGLVENCYNDCAQRTLSIRETKKLNRVSTIALETFRELAEKDGVIAWQMNIDSAYLDYAYEVAEHATMEAIKQSEMKKVDLLGRYYGRQFYKGATDWQDMHQMITMAGALSFRQIVMIRLIADDFKGMDKKMFISNPSACVEMNQLLSYGIWQTSGAPFGTNNSWAIQLDSIIPTYFSDQVCEALMLDRLEENDIKIAIDSLGLTEEGEKQSELTEDDYKSRTTFRVEGTKLILPGGKEFDKNVDGIDGGEY